MVASVACPLCGHEWRSSQADQGENVRCPACRNFFPNPARPAPSLLARSATGQPKEPIPAPSVNRTMLAQPEPMIRYTCPRCKKSLESPASFAGQKLHCPDCNQRLQIPQPSIPPASAPVNKTILATEVGSPAVPTAPNPLLVPGPKVEAVEEVHPVIDHSPVARRESCLECGQDITGRSRVQACPDCGSPFCSAACYREHVYHAHPRKQRARPDAPTENGMAVTGLALGIIAFVVMFFPCIGWVGILLAIPGTIFSGIGLAESGQAGVGKGNAVTGLVLSLLTIILYPLLYFLIWASVLGAGSKLP